MSFWSKKKQQTSHVESAAASSSPPPYPSSEDSVSLDKIIITDQANQKKSFWGFLWDTADLEPEERKLLFKVDASLLIFASLGYFIKNLDQSNVNNAFLSGMKEDLNLYGNELVTSTSIWTVGYVIGQIPANLLVTRIEPRFVIPSLEIGWGVCTLATYCIKDYRALYALRFLVGLFESGFYPVMIFILGSWYTPRELNKRATLFWASGNLGTLLSGVLQSAAYTHLDGVNGLAGWRWLFIIDAIITIPIAIFGFIFLPALPWDAKPSFVLSARDIQIAQARMKAVGRAGKQPWTRQRVVKFFSTWHFYVLPLLYVIWNNGFIQTPYGYWLKSFNASPPPVPGISYSVPQINILPIPTSISAFVGSIIFSWVSDGTLRGRRWPLPIVGAFITIIFSAILLKLPVYHHDTAHKVVYSLIQIGSGAGPAILNWINEISGADHEYRSILVASANDFAYVVQAIANPFVWPTTGFPAARIGMKWVLSLNAILIPWTLLVLFLHTRDLKRKAMNPDPEQITTEDIKSAATTLNGDAAEAEKKGVAVDLTEEESKAVAEERKDEAENKLVVNPLH